MFTKTVFAVAAITIAGAVQAQVAPVRTILVPAPMRVMLGFGVVGGGDDLVTAQRTNGGSDTLKAGDGVIFSAGIDYRVNPAFSLQASAGYHRSQISADNGKVEFTRVPVELLGFYHFNENWRLGGGVRYVSKPTLKGSGVANMPDFEFNSTTGGVIEAEYLLGRNWGFQLRYVHETLKADGYRDTNADQAGLGVRYYF
ncbi:outer membrane beta-barrel protein [Massilia sp. S19_KUP03_FR1]|uniref:outer membrane beta-barrel protein n=1 Tax=Massilia sp. S19_KUP03_FR1 TaxID=3025503 RepID=UPI002FCD81FD